VVRIAVSVTVAAPIETVWGHVERIEDHVAWMADATAIEFLSDRRRGVGTSFRVTTRVGPLRTADVMEVTAWDPPCGFEVEHRGRVSGIGSFRLEPVDGGTRLDWTESLRFPWHFGGEIGAVVARPILRRIFSGNLRSLKERIEGG
jgi:carbon monoxide dehydrogenase subunit G